MPAVWWTMNQSADFTAAKHGFTRQELDEYVVMSQKRVTDATAAGKYSEEIVAFATQMKVIDKASGQSSMADVTLDRDEGPRPDTTLEKLLSLKPVYEGGTTTAGNASQLSDGAAACVMMDADLAAQRGLPVLGYWRGFALGAVAPEDMST